MRARVWIGTTALTLVLAAAGGCDDGPEDPSGDRLVISIGDSVASGEGVPDQRANAIVPAAWRGGGKSRAARRSARRCHRSRLSGNAVAAAAVLAEEEDARFVSLGCSGATIDVGLRGPYEGIQPDRVLERRQLERVEELAAEREVSAVLVSIGANDLGFGDIVRFCTFKPTCQRAEFPDPARPTQTMPLADYIPIGITRLARAYARLAGGLPDELDPSDVIITEYFDPTSPPPGYVRGAGCEMLVGGVTSAESTWAREDVLGPLNAEIERAAREHGWTLVEGIDERFQGHGLCARGPNRWVTTLRESLTGQGIPLLGGVPLLERLRDLLASHKGTLHPNRAGHREIAALIEPHLREALAD